MLKWPDPPFYARLIALLDAPDFDRFVEKKRRRFCAPRIGRPSLAPGGYFRLLLLDYFEGINSERGIAWRATDSLVIRSFLELGVHDAPPDDPTISRTRRVINLETDREVFASVQERLVDADWLKGKTIAIDATTLEANAAMRSVVQNETEESYQEFLTRLTEAPGTETPTREDLARLDRTRKKKTSNTVWTNPTDPDAKVANMKLERTHLAHKAEHAVNLETGAVVAVTLQGADKGDTTTIVDTAIGAAAQVEDAQTSVPEPQSLEEIIADKAYRCTHTMVDLDAVNICTYIAEPDRRATRLVGGARGSGQVYGNRCWIRGRRERRLMLRRDEWLESSFAHVYDTGGMPRTHLRGHTNILNRVLIHAGGFNPGSSCVNRSVPVRRAVRGAARRSLSPRY